MYNFQLTRLEELLTQAESTFSSMQECLEVMRAIPLERFDCPLCTQMFVSRLEAQEHMSTEHSNERLNFYCEVRISLLAPLLIEYLLCIGLSDAIQRSQATRTA